MSTIATASDFEDNGIVNKYKIVFCGDERVGKTSLLQRYLSDAFSPHYESTIGADLSQRSIVFHSTRVNISYFQRTKKETKNKKNTTSRSSSQQKPPPYGSAESDNHVNESSTTSSTIFQMFNNSLTSLTSTHDDDDDFQQTAALNFMKELSITDEHGAVPDKMHPPIPARLQLWDTAGKDRFRSMIPQYLKDCTVAVIVYDVTQPNTFEHAKSWMDLVLYSDPHNDEHQLEEGQSQSANSRTNNQKTNNTILFLVANKVDALEEKATTNHNVKTKKKQQQKPRLVTTFQGLELADRYQATYVEVSSAAGYNVKYLMEKIAFAIYRSKVIMED